MPVEIEKAFDAKSIVGESLFWDEETQSIYYVDILGKTVNRFIPSTKKHATALVGDKNVAFILPIEGERNKFLISHGNQLVKLTWDGVSDKIEGLETICELEDTVEKKHGWNDGKVSPTGQFWGGTYIPTGEGEFISQHKASALYELDEDKILREIVLGTSLPNGLVWNEKINKFYFAESIEGCVFEYDYKLGELSNKKSIFTVKDHGFEGIPDNMTIDTEGNLWLAIFGGGKVVKIDPNHPNTVVGTIDMPVKQVSCTEFGGPNCDELYVTSCAFAFNGQEIPEGGWTYKVTGLGAKGYPKRKLKL